MRVSLDLDGDILWFVRDQVAEVAGLLLDFSEWYLSIEVQQTYSNSKLWADAEMGKLLSVQF